jgi:hypothetical protein
MDRGPGVTLELVRTTPKTPHKTPPKAPAKTLTPPALLERARRQRTHGAAVSLPRRALRRCGCSRFGELPPPAVRTTTPPPPPPVRRSAATSVVVAAPCRSRLANRRPTDSIPCSQPPDQSLCTDDRFPPRARAPSINPMRLQGRLPNTTGKAPPRRNVLARIQIGAPWWAAPVRDRDDRHPYRKVPWRPNWGQPAKGPHRAFRSPESFSAACIHHQRSFRGRVRHRQPAAP